MDYQEHVKSTEHVQGNATDDDFYSRVERAKVQAREHAIGVALKFVPDISDTMNREIPSIFGGRWAKRVSRSRDLLLEEHGEKAIWITKLAVRHFEFAKWDASGFMARLRDSAETKKHDPNNNADWPDLTTPDAYIDYEGWANTAFNSFGETDNPTELLSGFSLEEYPQDSEMLLALGLVWFFEAANLHQHGDPRCMDVLFESSDAFSFANSIDMWSSGYELGREEQSANAVRELTKKAADARHRGSRDKAEQIKAWYTERRHQFSSIDDAAEAAMLALGAKFRTAHKHISVAAKALRDARKA